MSQEKNLELALDDLDISVKAFVSLSEYGAFTLGHVVGMSIQELEQVLGDEALVQSVLREVFTHGFHPAGDIGFYIDEDQPVPEEGETWGGVFVYLEDDDALESLASSIVSIYESNGSIEIPWDVQEELEATIMPFDTAPSFQEDGILPDIDDVCIIEQEAEGWYAVLSSQLEWSPINENPLAVELSEHFPDVIAMTSVAGQYVEITQYAKGFPIGNAVTGRSVHPHTRATKKPINLLWFLKREAMGDVIELYESLSDLDSFGSLTGCETQGYRRAMEEFELNEFTPRTFFNFR